MFPKNFLVKKIILVCWWFGEGFLESEDESDEFCEELGSKGLIEKLTNSFKIQPSVRSAVISLAQEHQFAVFDSTGCPTSDFRKTLKAFLTNIDREEDSLQGVRDWLRTLFNVNWYLDLDLGSCKDVTVLQLGRSHSSPEHLVHVINEIGSSRCRNRVLTV